MAGTTWNRIVARAALFTRQAVIDTGVRGSTFKLGHYLSFVQLHGTGTEQIHVRAEWLDEIMERLARHG